jgi:hypothetical protein
VNLKLHMRKTGLEQVSDCQILKKDLAACS